jgi:GH15 family glucan-1,4-alpha-glucosidase
MTHPQQPDIRDLGIIGDQKTCALVDKNGTIAWFCPERFDTSAICSLLVDDEKGGYWAVEAGADFASRRYLTDSSILRSEYSRGAERFTLTDWMPYAEDEARQGICRLTSPFTHDLTHRIRLRDNYGLEEVVLRRVSDTAVQISGHGWTYLLTASHPVVISEGLLSITVPAGEVGWAYLATSSDAGEQTTGETIDQSLTGTLTKWKDIFGMFSYKGVYEEQVFNSCRAICLMTHKPSGGIIAAATTSLPEGFGNGRNYDYRYVWLRDAAMIVSAHIRAIGMTGAATDFLGFLCSARTGNADKRIMPFYDLNLNVAESLKEIPLNGYKNEKPVVIGNGANEQLQLDANANVLLAAKQIYAQLDDKPNWETVRVIADFLAENWQQKDHGIWEEHVQEHFTSSKVIAAKGLEFIAKNADNEEQAAKWKQAAADIREFVAKNCLTESGAYAVYAGSSHVDVTAALYPVWLYDEPDSPEMKATIKEIEEVLREGDLYHRRLEQFDAQKEGVFLAGSLWVAQYYIMLNNLEKSRKIIEATLEYANDLGYLAEECHIPTGEMLGNFPQTFVHASLMGALVDLDVAEGKKNGEQIAVKNV